MNEKMKIHGQENPYEKFEPSFDVLPLPSQGLFYPEINGEKVDKVKVKHLTAEDEGIMLAPNLIQSGQMINVLLRKKVESPYPVDKMIVGDRLAILVYLRATMEQFYNVNLVDPKTGESFTHTVDLAKLEIKELTHLPNEDGLFDFKLPKSGRTVKFRLMTGEDEEAIKAKEAQIKKVRKVETDLFKMLRNDTIIVSVEGITDKFEKEAFLKNMPLMDSRRLDKYIQEVTPTINLEIEVPTPSGGNFRKNLPLTAEFLYPSI